MQVVIDGVQYRPMVSASRPDGSVKPIHLLLQGARLHQGLTLEAAAVLANLKVNKVYRAECGEVTLKTAVALADAYGIPMEQIARSVRGK